MAVAAEYSAIIYAVQDTPGAWGSYLEEKMGGKAVLNHSIDTFDDDASCAEILIVPDAPTREWIGGNPLSFASPKQRVMPLGKTRAESVHHAVAEARKSVVVIHDALRPNFGAELLARLLAAAEKEEAVAAAWPDSGPQVELKAAAGGGEKLKQPEGFFGPRAEQRLGHAGQRFAGGTLWTVQYPQAFRRESYLRAAEKAGKSLSRYTDDSEMVAAGGCQVALVRGRLENIRLSGQDELRLLQKLLGTPPKKKDKYGGLGW